MNDILENVCGKLHIDTTEMNNMIDLYINNRIEPSYDKLYYDDKFKGRIYYDHATSLAIIENKRELLQEQLKNLDIFEYLISKKAYPDKYNEYLTTLFKENKTKFYEIMNEECEYIPGGGWNEENIDEDFCTLLPVGPVMCERCYFHWHIVHFHGVN